MPGGQTIATIRANKAHARKGRRPNLRRPRGRKSKLATAIKDVLMRNAETKAASFYSNNYSTTGAYPAAWAVQNQMIASNSSDILQVIPYIVQGTGDNQRTGKAIKPVSFTISCSVSLNPVYVNGTAAYPNNIIAVAYLLQHKSLKSMQALKYVGLVGGTTGNNDFNQLLDSNDGGVRPFSGLETDSKLGVASQYYKVLGKRVFQLRNDYYGTSPGASISGNSQAVPLRHSWTWNATRHFPKTLEYPEVGTSTDPNIRDLPTNSSLFWCVGYFQQTGTNGTSAVPAIQQQYTTILKFKDF